VRRGRAFPITARPDAVPTPASKLKWFVTSQSTRPQMVDGRLVDWPSSLVHAKRMGSTVTACGLNASSWRKLFHVPFPPARTETCKECVARVRSARGSA
jgi:hypothetical protein